MMPELDGYETLATIKSDEALRHVPVIMVSGIDELDSGGTRVSWRSPLANALLKARVGDVVTLRTPQGNERLEVLDIRYDPLE